MTGVGVEPSTLHGCDWQLHSYMRRMSYSSGVTSANCPDTSAVIDQ